MAWLDDRVWCHPKLADVSKAARWTWVAAITYSSGFQTGGKVTNGQLAQLGATTRERRELVAASLWHEIEGGVEINDWDEHNGKRDARRKADRERKRLERERDPDSWVIRSGKWQHTRKEVFERDHGVCVDCGEITEGWHADHVPDRKTLRENGLDPFDLQYIQTRCQTCHGRRHILDRTGGGKSKGQKKGQSVERRALTGDRVTDEVKALGLSLVREMP